MELNNPQTLSVSIMVRTDLFSKGGINLATLLLKMSWLVVCQGQRQAIFQPIILTPFQNAYGMGSGHVDGSNHY